MEHIHMLAEIHRSMLQVTCVALGSFISFQFILILRAKYYITNHGSIISRNYRNIENGKDFFGSHAAKYLTRLRRIGYVTSRSKVRTE